MHNDMQIEGHPGNASFIMVYEDVWQSLLGDPYALAVYMALIRRTHPGNRSWYSKKKIMAKESGIGVTAFEVRVDKLKGMGLVIVTPQYRNPDTGEISTSRDGGFIEQIQNIYTVRDHMPAPHPQDGPPHPPNGRPHPQGGRPSPAEQAPLARQTGANIDPIHKPPTQTPSTYGADAPKGKKRTRHGYSTEFETFWKVWPNTRGQSKFEVSKKFDRALKAADAETILDGARRFAADPNLNVDYCPAPTTWLNNRRWESGPLPERSQQSPRQGGHHRPSPEELFLNDLRNNNHQHPDTDHPWLGAPTTKEIEQ